MNKETKKRILDKLEEMYPEAKAELVFSNPYEMLVATMLSAQCTDKQVNKVTPAVFERWPDANAMAEARVDELFPMVKSCGFKSKAGNIIAACRIIKEQHGGHQSEGMQVGHETEHTDEDAQRYGQREIDDEEPDGEQDSDT